MHLTVRDHQDTKSINLSLKVLLGYCIFQVFVRECHALQFVPIKANSKGAVFGKCKLSLIVQTETIHKT